MLDVSHIGDLSAFTKDDIEQALRDKNVPEKFPNSFMKMLKEQHDRIDEIGGNLCNIVYSIYLKSHKALVEDYVEQIAMSYALAADDLDSRAIFITANMMNWHSLYLQCAAALYVLRCFENGRVVVDSLPDMPRMPIAAINKTYADVFDKVSSLSVKKQCKLFKQAAKHLVRDADAELTNTTCLINPFLLHAQAPNNLEPLSLTPSNPECVWQTPTHLGSLNLVSHIRDAVSVATTAGVRPNYKTQLVSIYHPAGTPPVMRRFTITDPTTPHSANTGPASRPNRGELTSTHPPPVMSPTDIIRLATTHPRSPTQERELADAMRVLTAEGMLELCELVSTKVVPHSDRRVMEEFKELMERNGHLLLPDAAPQTMATNQPGPSTTVAAPPLVPPEYHATDMMANTPMSFDTSARKPTAANPTEVEILKQLQDFKSNYAAQLREVQSSVNNLAARVSANQPGNTPPLNLGMAATPTAPPPSLPPTLGAPSLFPPRRELGMDLEANKRIATDWVATSQNLLIGLEEVAATVGNPYTHILSNYRTAALPRAPTTAGPISAGALTPHSAAPNTPVSGTSQPSPPNTLIVPSSASAMKGLYLPKWKTDVNDFFGRMEMFFKLTGTPEHQWIAATLLNIPLHNVSQRWFTHTSANPARTHTWNEFKEQITIFTRGHSAKNRALAELATCTQGSSSIDQYISRYATLVSQTASDSTAPHIVEGFLRGLSDVNLRTILTMAPNGLPWTNLMALQNHASVLSVARYTNTSTNKNTRNPNSSNRPFSKRTYSGAAGEKETNPQHPGYGKTKAERSLYMATNALNTLRNELSGKTKAKARNYYKPKGADGASGSGGGGGGGSGGASGGGGGGRFGGTYGARAASNRNGFESHKRKASSDPAK
jgi:uncharacterized membrane protein YgcG